MAEHAFTDEGALLAVLDEALEATAEVGAPFLFMGGIASSLLGRRRGARDVDLFVRPEDVDALVAAFAARGFETEIPHPHWLAKASRRDVTVDLISRSSPDILLDDEMLDRSLTMDFHGRRLRVVPPEDLFVMKAMATGEDTPRYWYDALGIVGHNELDWDYLIRRARAAGVSRVLSALFYARSSDLVVPVEPLRTLFDLAVRAQEPRPVPQPTGSSSRRSGDDGPTPTVRLGTIR